MCHDRGYLVDEEDLNLDLSGWCERFGDKPSEGRPLRMELNFIVEHQEDVSGPIQWRFGSPFLLIFFCI